jgi:hypothetical protein
MTMKLGVIFILVIHLAACGGSSGGSSSGSSGSSSDGGSSDITSPFVSSTNPAHNATGVATNRSVTATFNKDIDPATIKDISFILDDQNGSPITGDVSYDAASKTAIFRNGALAPDTTYTATITRDVEDLVGNPLANDYAWQFTTASPSSVTPPVTPPVLDTTPPTVVSRFPAPNANSVETNVTVSVTFSEPIDPTTINSQSLTLSLNGTTPVAGTVTYVGTTALFTPSTNLATGAAYTVSVAETVSDLAGNFLVSAPVVWDFTTGSSVDSQPPIVLSVSPPDNAVNVPTNSSLEVTFNEAIKPFEFVLLEGRPVTVTFNAAYTTVTLTPTASLRPGSTYESRITVSDQAGNRMTEPFIWRFTTSP